MLGIGKVPEILTTREVEDAFTQGLQGAERDDEVWIISPYNTLDKLGTIRRYITEACKIGARVTYVVRDQSDQVDGARQSLVEAMDNGLELFALDRLHAKLYWFDYRFAIVTSANMVDGSFDKSTEIGLYVPAGGLFEDLRGWIAKEIVPNARNIGAGKSSSRMTPTRTATHRTATVPRAPQKNGFCLRCGKGIQFNTNAPYCLDDYKVWAQYGNPDFVEKHCHACGGKSHSSMGRPLCRQCYRNS